MDTSTPGGPGSPDPGTPDPSTPDPSEFDGGQPDRADDETPDVLFPDTLGAHGREEPLPRADEADALEQQTDAVPDAAAGDAEDERRD